MTKEIAFRALTAVTAGFFWLAIMRFLSSYDQHMLMIERVGVEIRDLKSSVAVWSAGYDARIKSLDDRVSAIEGARHKKGGSNEI